MDIINENRIVPYEKTAVALGDFDGLHAAHTELIRKGMEYARKNNLKIGVFLFEENTKSVLEQNIRLITENEDRLRLIEDTGVDFVYKVRFDSAFMKKTPEEFIEYLVEKLHICAVFTGYNYRFGYKAQGDTQMLLGAGEQYGFKTFILPQMSIDGETVSSTHIRSLIEQGRVEEAKKFLGRSFYIGGTVERGLQNGRKMGFPTANVSYNEKLVIPESGVYAGLTYVHGEEYKSVINVGNNPTFNGARVTIESHLFDFDEEIYGEKIKVSFVKKIRDDIKFGGTEQLARQIQKDAAEAERILKGR